MRMAVRVIGDFSPAYMYFGSPALITVFALDCGLALVTRAGEESSDVKNLVFDFFSKAPEEDIFRLLRDEDELLSGVRGGVGRAGLAAFGFVVGSGVFDTGAFVAPCMRMVGA